MGFNHITISESRVFEFAEKCIQIFSIQILAKIKYVW